MEAGGLFDHLKAGSHVPSHMSLRTAGWTEPGGHKAGARGQREPKDADRRVQLGSRASA